MQNRRKKRKAGNRARKHIAKAWEAVERDELHIAVRETRRAVDERPDNPAHWLDSGLILELAGELDEAESALRNAILIAPTFAEAYATLAKVLATRGRTIQAARMQEHAVEHAPEEDEYRRRLEVYRSMCPQEADQDVDDGSTRLDVEVEAKGNAFAIAQSDRERIARELTEEGIARLPGLLDPAQCAELIELYPRTELFEKTVHLDSADEDLGGSAAYRFFREPAPQPIREVRSAVYAAIVATVNGWNERLGLPDRYPASLEEFHEFCVTQGQFRPTAILLRYEAPASNESHQDVWGRVVFPLQLAITLCPRREEKRDGADAPAEGQRDEIQGGEFLFADDSAGRSSRRREIATAQGEGVVFCTRSRIVRVAGTDALQPVKHGMSPLTSGTRFVLGLPFHLYK